MTSPCSSTSCTGLWITRITWALFDPDQQAYLTGLDDGVCRFSRNPSQAQVFLSEARAHAVQQTIRPRLTLRQLRFIRPAAEPLSWRLADE